MTLRVKQRLSAMTRVQQTAVEMFTQRSFETVTVEEIATAAGVSPVSVYRWFGTKEGVVLWDEYDPPLFEAITAALSVATPLEAVRTALVSELDAMYDGERELVLSRVKLIASEPALLIAAQHNAAQLTEALATLFDSATESMASFESQVMAAAIVAVLTTAILEWATLDGTVGLGVLIERGFEVLGTTG